MSFDNAQLSWTGTCFRTSHKRLVTATLRNVGKQLDAPLGDQTSACVNITIADALLCATNNLVSLDATSFLAFATAASASSLSLLGPQAATTSADSVSVAIRHSALQAALSGYRNARTQLQWTQSSIVAAYQQGLASLQGSLLFVTAAAAGNAIAFAVVVDLFWVVNHLLIVRSSVSRRCTALQSCQCVDARPRRPHTQ